MFSKKVVVFLFAVFLVVFSGSVNASEINASETVLIAQGGVGILPQSEYRYLTESDLVGLSEWELNIARNEIYARHGRPFSKAEYRNYFYSQWWYKEDPYYSDSWLSEVELYNASFIKEYQSSGPKQQVST